jgi:hypothetical protein
MLLPASEIQAICAASPGLEAWILPEGGDAGDDLLHFGGPGQVAAGGDAR